MLTSAVAGLTRVANTLAIVANALGTLVVLALVVVLLVLIPGLELTITHNHLLLGATVPLNISTERKVVHR